MPHYQLEARAWQLKKKESSSETQDVKRPAHRLLLRGAVIAILTTFLAFGVTAGVRVVIANGEASKSAARYDQHRDVAIVPGAWVHRRRPGPMLAERLTVALELFRAHLVDAVFVSGNEAAGETSAMARWLRDHGVPDSDVLVDDHGTRTIETMRHASRDLGFRSAFICTQPISMPRSIYLARAYSIDAVPAPAALDLPHASRWTLIEAAKSALAVAETFAEASPTSLTIARNP